MRFDFLIAGLALASSASAAAAPKPTSYVLTGDSTTAPVIGWGDQFCKLTARCYNIAASGRTTATFRSDGYFQKALDRVKADVAAGFAPRVTIQFGHNDQKVMDTTTFKKNMAGLIADIKKAGGKPIVVTSLCRRTFNSKGVLTDKLEDWAVAAEQQADTSSVPYVDLHGKCIKYISAIGKDSAMKLNAKTGKTPGDVFDPKTADTTHLNTEGGIIFSRVVGDLITARIANAGIKANPALSAKINAGKAVY
ncbi:SGNH hydrolase-type esterase domain-containing protein [Fimicolochytrium jonesii]|uniref:SGNH hydrolase-type esterase domain-containing protein n=1 Tax=Fimicolochytrium jonesii TaxID=1396493 RepID=UPI0022FF1D91|nr:SGNH hydrolase-type esterase domain-containing protein [Fimicolochytrium jonesii]KAI8823386.1 SGNH hydrolase-type esterase domain-containing protein [Fimicolochytrium jonesii]